jgi:hypothetical protein
MINGHMRTPKIHVFFNLVDYLNRKNPTLNMVALPLDTSPLCSNAWLAGFIEADGSFQVRTSLTSKVKRLGISFELSQARVNHNGLSNLDYMSLLADFLKVSVNPIRENSKFPQFRVRTSTIVSNTILMNYLLEYPVLGSKYMDFKDWSTILGFFVAGTHWENVKTIVNLKVLMNDGRTTFN